MINIKRDIVKPPPCVMGWWQLDLYPKILSAISWPERRGELRRDYKISLCFLSDCFIIFFTDVFSTFTIQGEFTHYYPVFVHFCPFLHVFSP